MKLENTPVLNGMYLDAMIYFKYFNLRRIKEWLFHHLISIFFTLKFLIFPQVVPVLFSSSSDLVSRSFFLLFLDVSFSVFQVKVI